MFSPYDRGYEVLFVIIIIITITMTITITITITILFLKNGFPEPRFIRKYKRNEYLSYLYDMRN